MKALMHPLPLLLAGAVLALTPACGGKADKPKQPAKPTVTAPPPTRAAPAEAKPAEGPAKAAGVTVDKAVLAAFAALPEQMSSEDNPVTDAKVDLGRMLYFETRISKNHDLSCNSCHDLAKYGVDNLAVSPGHRKQNGTRNSPTVYNAAGHVAQFWDGREPTVEAQAKGPVLNPVEMAMPNAEAVVAVLKSMPGYVGAFEKAFPGEADPVTYDNFAKAVGAFERNLVTPSRWDGFLAGDDKALSDGEKEGFNLFVSTGCITCHSGAYVGGSTFQKLGAVVPWPNQKDQGKFEATKQEADKMMFKVPSLRNIDKTGPYFHDGSEADLVKVTQLMARHQLGKTLSDADAGKIVTWMATLTGPLPADYIKPPELPKSTETTPKPDPS